MIIESVQLTHVGPFSQPVAVGPFTPGLNILSAPNETGKSTLIKAATRALFDRHTCKDGEIKSLQPAGSDLAPKITVAFQVAKEKYRLEKAFLLSPKCLLSEWRGSGWQAIAEGDAADTRMQQLLRSKTPGRGATNAAHWGLLRYLWARQGEPASWPDWDGEAGHFIQSRLVKIEVDPLIEQLRSSLWTDYLESFTPTGQIKAGGPLRKAEDELAEIEQELGELQRRRQELEQLQTDYKRLGAEVEALEIEAAESRKQAAAVREAASQAEVLSAELRLRQNELDTAKTDLGKIRADDEEIRQSQDALNKVQEQLTLAEERGRHGTNKEAEAQNKLHDAEKNWEAQSGQVNAAQARLERVRDLLKYKRSLQQCEQIEALYKRVSKQLSDYKRMQEQRARLPQVTAQQLKIWDEMERGLRDKEVRLQATGLTIELEPLSKAQVEWTDGEKRSASLEAGERKSWQDPQSVNLHLIGWGSVRVRTGAAEAKQLQSELQAEQSKLAKSISEAGLANLEDGRAALNTRQELDAQIRSASDLLKSLLGEWNTEEKLVQELNVRRSRVDALTKTLKTMEAEERMTLAEMEAEEQSLEVQHRQQDQQLKDQLKQIHQLRHDLQRLREERLQEEKQLGKLKSEKQSLEVRLNTLQARYPEGIREALSKAQSTFVDAEARLDVVQRKLPPDFERLPERNRRAAQACEQVAQDLQRRRQELSQIEGNLKARGSEGLYSRETALIEKREVARRAAEAARSEGWAARLIYALIENRKQAATRSVLAPLEERLSSAFAEVSGDDHRRVFLDEHLQVRGVGRNEEQLIAFDALSQGAKEQLLLSLRLAIAMELSVEEPQLLVLDDVLVNTDSVRQQRILDVLRTNAEKLQILILTCHPERYRGVGTMLTFQRQGAD